MPLLSDFDPSAGAVTYASPVGVKAEVRTPDGQWTRAEVALEKDSRGVV